MIQLSGSQLLMILGAGETTAPTLGPTERIGLFKTSVANLDRETARLQKDPQVVRDLARLDRAIDKAKSPEDLFKDPEAVRVLLQGLGLADQAANVGLAKAALLSDPKDAKSLAARLPDTRWKTAAAQLDFAGTGMDTLRGTALRETIAKGLVDYKRLTKIGEQSEAVADALYLRNMPEGTTPNVYDVLGNKVLRRIATTLAGLPKELALQGVEAQARSLERGIKLADFADPRKREVLIQRYLAVAADTATANDPLAGLGITL
ncbi:DUF1217 domain-containing protein [Roseomonas frigidaquae]|uniref:DUF1217 domain-containing protein n=1 Tax=Falsiroseomonas frigidaquae TaxID=487318 RepID=A0ABX1ES13_9PROT|nr:DUF1217 domain-containing protein [Falsiroseomonas frigidaquae]NKE43305.1 DUF1217 domain-containing protein [Falsiroseomonas frigidaquae]